MLEKSSIRAIKSEYPYEEKGNNLLQSRKGYSIEVLPGRVGGIVYTEGSKSLKVDSELLVGSPGMVIFPIRIRSWDPPYDSEEIDQTGRDEIVERIRDAFLFWRYDIDVVEADLAYNGPWPDEDVEYILQRLRAETVPND